MLHVTVEDRGLYWKFYGTSRIIRR